MGKRKKHRHGKNGYLNLATNYPRLWKEVEKIKNTIRIFNISRNNLINFKNKIKSQLSIEDLTKGTIKDDIKLSYSSNEETFPREDSPTVLRMKNKLTYSRSEFKKISIDTFRSDSIQEVLKNWETTNHMKITKEAIEVLENTKIQNPKILSWDNYKLINRLSEHWSDRKNIEEKLTDEAIKRVREAALVSWQACARI